VQKKNLAQVAIMLATFLLAIPAAPVRATTPAGLSISPSSASAGLGGTFSATVMVSAVDNLQAYDFRVFFNPGIIHATSASLGHTVFDLNNNGDISDDPVIVAKLDVLNFPAGVVRAAATLLGGVTVSVATSAALLTINFQVNTAFLGTSSDLPSSITVDTHSTFVGFDSGTGMQFPIATVVTGGLSFTPPPANFIDIRSVGCRAATGGLNIGSAHGFTDGLFCRIDNFGLGTVGGYAVFEYHSLHGITGSITGSVISLAPGQNGDSSANLVVPQGVLSDDIFIVTGHTHTTYIFPDGSTFGSADGPSQSFVINING